MEVNVYSPFQLFGHPFTFSAHGLARPGRRNRPAKYLAGRAWAESKQTLRELFAVESTRHCLLSVSLNLNAGQKSCTTHPHDD
jgi:hypothetical protein